MFCIEIGCRILNIWLHCHKSSSSSSSSSSSLSSLSSSSSSSSSSQTNLKNLFEQWLLFQMTGFYMLLCTVAGVLTLSAISFDRSSDQDHYKHRKMLCTTPHPWYPIPSTPNPPQFYIHPDISVDCLLKWLKSPTSLRFMAVICPLRTRVTQRKARWAHFQIATILFLL